MSADLNPKNCQHIKEDGTQCQGYPMDGEDYCYTHNPDVPEEEKRAMQAKGGANTKITILNPLPPLALEQPKDVLKLLADTINRVRSGTMDIKIANCIGFLSGHMLKGFEISELKDKIELLESFLSQRK